MEARGRTSPPLGAGQTEGSGARLPAVSPVIDRLLARSGLSTWAPRGRTHLLCAACSGLLTLLSVVALYPYNTWALLMILVSGTALAALSVWPLGAAALCLVAVIGQEPIAAPLPLLGPWLCASVLVSRGFKRVLGYGVAACSAALTFLSYRIRLQPVYDSIDATVWTEIYPPVFLLGVACLVLAELIRQPRTLTEAAARQHEENLERQRLLVVSELHDTVVRDLSHAVMLAEQARLAKAPGQTMEAELSAMTASVRTAVEQLRNSLRSIGQADAGSGLDLLASTAPRPLEEVIDEARTVLRCRGTDLHTEGLELLGTPMVGPGVRQQLTRVLSELVSNMAKYATPGGPARLLLESDGQTLEAMIANTFDPQAPHQPGTSSGLGLSGALRRVESLGGSLHVTSTTDRWTVTLSVPLQHR